MLTKKKTMKQLNLLAISIIAILFAISCSKEEQMELTTVQQSNNVLKKATLDPPIFTGDKDDISEVDWPVNGCGLQNFDLIGGQTIDMGSVSAIAVDETPDESGGWYLYIKYHAKDGCMLTETHLFVGDAKNDLPQNNGNPQIGHFPFSWEGEESEVVIFKIPVDHYGCYDIAAHAVVSCTDGCQETAWAKSDEIVFSLKTLIDGVYYITGNPDCGPDWEGWCDRLFDYKFFDFETTEPQVYDLIDLYGCVSDKTIIIEKTGLNTFSFQLCHNDGEVERTRIFVGSEEDFDRYGCDYLSYPYTGKCENEVTISSLKSIEFDGNRWGWYISNYCIVDCSE